MVSSPSTQTSTLISDFEDILCNGPRVEGVHNIAFLSIPHISPFHRLYLTCLIYHCPIRRQHQRTRLAFIPPESPNGHRSGALVSTLSRYSHPILKHFHPTPSHKVSIRYKSPFLHHWPYLLDLSLPHSSSPSQTSDDSLDFMQRGPSATSPACVDSHAVSPADSGMRNTHLPSFVR